MKADQGTMRWIVKTAHKNMWRMPTWCELDDLIQDGMIHWQRVVQRYPNVTARPHMMRLFMITYINHIHDLAKKRTRAAESLFCDLQRDNEFTVGVLENIIDQNSDAAEIQALAAMAPEVVAATLRLYFSEKDRKRLRSHYRRGPNRETFNQRLCRLIGADPERTNVVEEIRAYFSDEATA